MPHRFLCRISCHFASLLGLWATQGVLKGGFVLYIIATNIGSCFIKIETRCSYFSCYPFPPLLLFDLPTEKKEKTIELASSYQGVNPPGKGGLGILRKNLRCAKPKKDGDGECWNTGEKGVARGGVGWMLERMGGRMFTGLGFKIRISENIDIRISG